MSTKTPYTEWKNLPTCQSDEILTELIEAKQLQAARLLIAPTGLGKTNTIKLFKKQFEADTFIVTVGDSYKLVDVLDSLLEQLGITKWKNETRIRQKLQMVADALLKVKGKPIIIIDESENLKPNSLRMMKELFDHTFIRCSIVMIATEDIIETIHNRRRRNRTGVPQLWSRLKAGVRYITDIDKARDFVPFFKMYIPKEENLQDLLMELCANYRELHDYMHPVLLHAAKKNEDVTEKMFRILHKVSPNQQTRRA